MVWAFRMQDLGFRNWV